MLPIRGNWILAAIAIVEAIAIALIHRGGKHGARRKGHHLRVLGVIPARYASTRFPGKALVPIKGVPMVVRTYRQAAKAARLDCLVVATDDHRIVHVCQAEQIPVVKTSTACNNGTERCLETVVALERNLPSFDLVINIQGDEPLIEPEVIDEVVDALAQDPQAVYSTACTPLPPAQAALSDRVKCVTDQHGNALYFSRSAIPGNKSGRPRPDGRYLLHLGLQLSVNQMWLQAYDRKFLATFKALPATPLMLSEDLEQLKVLEHGHRMKVVVVDALAHGVDNPADVALIERLMQEKGIE